MNLPAFPGLRPLHVRLAPLRDAVWALAPWLLPFGLLLLWQLASRFGWMSAQVLPAPAQVWGTWLEYARGELWMHLLISLKRLALGLACGIAAGAALGAWMGAAKPAERLIFPVFSALAQVPTLAWIPLFMLFFGIGELLKLVVLVKAVVVPVTVHTFVGVRDVQPRLKEAAAAMRLPRRAVLRHLILPAALPSFMAGLRLAVASGWAALLAVELLASSEGIGYLMVWGRQLFMLDLVFVLVIVVGAFGIALDKGMDRLDRKLVFWPHPPAAALHPAPAQGGERWQAWLLPLALLALWQLASASGWAHERILASPFASLSAAWYGIADHSLPDALAVSLGRALGGLLIGGGLGLLLGLAAGLLPWLDRLLGGSLSVLRQVAVFAWVPLLTAWFGLGEAGKLAFIALITFFPLFVATRHGIASLSPQLEEAARAMRLSVWLRLTRCTLPGAAPAIFAGLRLALIYAWLGTIGAEYFMPSDGGIGNLMIGAQQIFRMDTVMAAMLLIGLAGAAINALGSRLEARITRWRTQ